MISETQEQNSFITSNQWIWGALSIALLFAWTDEKQLLFGVQLSKKSDYLTKRKEIYIHWCLFNIEHINRFYCENTVFIKLNIFILYNVKNSF